ncbi:MAG: MerR family transcriptional regulator [Bacteroidales bacterium]|nr:MerR family transcriptional regulator [Bacteroidales bacterium]
MATYTIKDLEKLSGIKAHTIRIWEKRYGIIEPQRTSTNIRTYCDLDLKRLLNISLLNQNGFKISKIANLSNDELSDKIHHLQQNPADTESQIKRLTLSMIELDEEKFEKILSRALIQLGFEDTIIKVIYPFFQKIGILWQTNIINPAQEHFVSNLIRQKMIVAIDSEMNIDHRNYKNFILYLPEGEWHEMGLLFFAYLIKKRGHRLIYLGQSVPMNDLIEVAKLRPADYIVTAFVSSINGQDIAQYLKNLSERLTNETIYVSGSQTSNLTDKLPSNVKIVSSPVEFIDILNKISVFSSN